MPAVFRVRRKNKLSMSRRVSDISEGQPTLTQVVRSYKLEPDLSSDDELIGTQFRAQAASPTGAAAPTGAAFIT